jgi:hypothetical protein
MYFGSSWQISTRRISSSSTSWLRKFAEYSRRFVPDELFYENLLFLKNWEQRWMEDGDGKPCEDWCGH